MQYVQRRSDGLSELDPNSVTVDSQGMEEITVTGTKIDWMLWALLAGLLITSLDFT